jgi:DNA-binding transcriptional regulator/RsmH inhibitor MraZ
LLESYFGLIEAIFVFGLAIAFYIWQKRDLRRYEEQDRKADRDGQDKV